MGSLVGDWSGTAVRLFHSVDNDGANGYPQPSPEAVGLPQRPRGFSVGARSHPTGARRPCPYPPKGGRTTPARGRDPGSGRLVPAGSGYQRAVWRSPPPRTSGDPAGSAALRDVSPRGEDGAGDRQHRGIPRKHQRRDPPLCEVGLGAGVAGAAGEVDGDEHARREVARQPLGGVVPLLDREDDVERDVGDEGRPPRSTPRRPGCARASRTWKPSSVHTMNASTPMPRDFHTSGSLRRVSTPLAAVSTGRRRPRWRASARPRRPCRSPRRRPSWRRAPPSGRAEEGRDGLAAVLARDEQHAEGQGEERRSSGRARRCR